VRLPSPLPSAKHRARRRSLVVPSAIIVAAAAVLTAGLVWWPRSDAPRAPEARSPALGTSSAPAAAASVGPLDVPAALGVLTRLDATRARAFAARDPQPLTRVYGSTALLARDRAALDALVPPGCGLRGARTSYRDLRVVRADGSSITLTVTATVAPSDLVCGGTAAGRAAGTPPIRLAVTLTRTARGWQVAALHPAAA
jgi:hypothetical protein